MAEESVPDSEQAGRRGGLSVVTAAIDGVRVLHLTGEIDHHTCEPLRQALNTLTADRPRVVVDMSGVTFMDSSGINTLIVAYKNVTAADGWIRLAAPTVPVLRVLRLVRVDELITCYPDLSQALVP
ncbi:STAS domain-containing protein [Streptomyces sp. P9-A2]|uniref:STAS domain-containing protein n=1 Tax=Streptomyces sp. P9-A2 TaxID=3072284 RepID=UPI002FC93C63